MSEGLRRLAASGAVASLTALAVSQPALAVCMPTTSAANGTAGPPAISATEASTTETLDKIRERREEIVTTSATTVEAASTAAAAVQAETAPDEPAVAATSSQVKAKKRKQDSVDRASGTKKVKTAEPAEAAHENMPEHSSAADQAFGGSAYGAWALGFVDYERHSNLAPGQQANPTRKVTTGGGLAGVDWSVVNRGPIPSGAQFGVFGGYSHAHGTFSDTSGSQIVNEPRVGDPTLVPVPYMISSSNSEQTTEGGIVGLYGSYFNGGFSTDIAFKVDIFDFSRSADVTQSKPTLVEDNGDPAVCGGGTQVINQRIAGSTDQTDYIIAGNVNYKYDLSGGYWIEPTFGIRYTYTDFGAGAEDLGLTNGEAFRVQGGVRLGTSRVLEGGSIWSTTLSGILYSDVMINGFNQTSSAFPTGFAAVDEGKVRVLGQLQSSLDFGEGTTLFGEVSVRGGEDLFGVGGLAGVRRTW